MKAKEMKELIQDPSFTIDGVKDFMKSRMTPDHMYVYLQSDLVPKDVQEVLISEGYKIKKEDSRIKISI